MKNNQLFDVYPRFDITAVRAKGVYLYDKNDQAYLDLYGGHGVISIGHGHPHYIDSLNRQINAIGFYSNSINMPIQEELAAKLTTQSAYDEYQLFLVNSGAEANENALKLASFHTEKKKIITFKNSFHGRTAAALSVTDNPKLFAPINKDHSPVEMIELNNTTQLLNALEQEDVAAVIVEGIQGIGGLDMPSDSYSQLLSTATKKHGALLILDEIQSGYGRSGQFFAHQYANIKADMITLAKGMGNGFPIGGLLIHPDIAATYGMLGTTFGGNHLACAAGIAVLDVLKQEKLMNHVQEISKEIRMELVKIPSIQQIKGRGLMLGIEFNFPIKEIRKQLIFDYQILTGSSANPNLLRILPPLNITMTEINPFFTALKSILK